MVAVIIPIYKDKPGDLEIISLNQCLRILKNYPIIFIYPSSINLTYYKDLIRNNQSVFFQEFSDQFFLDISGYNKLLTSVLFYRTFIQYKYVLIYQLDCFVFKDELLHWCQQGYDYIGAPWFELKSTNMETSFLGVGNGGFSLRRVKSHLRALRSFSYLINPNDFWKEVKNNFNWKAVKRLIVNVTVLNNTYHRFNNFPHNEDLFWGKIVTERFPWFKVPDMVTASKFAMELNAPSLFIKNSNQLPFGCHAFEKYTPEFWREFIAAE